MNRFPFLFFICIHYAIFARSQDVCMLGAEQMDKYISLISSQKRVAVVVNNTSFVKKTHLVDTLLQRGIIITKIFAPEHGFRGNVEAGKSIDSYKDEKTGLPIISLYGKHYKPSQIDMQDIDVLVFDIQDVGVRFYTYISTLHYVMEACAENNIKCVVLDRPNPHTHYVDGPVLESSEKSFVGMHTIPIVYGMTIGELANLINNEKWLSDTLKCDLTVIPLKNWKRGDTYILPIKPSPNLTNQNAIEWYPTLCLFEGTIMSVGRGTYFPFEVIGHTNPIFGEFTFTPVSLPEMAVNPKYKNQVCYGKDFRNSIPTQKINISIIQEFYKKSPDTASFFTKYFTTLAGTKRLKKQIQHGFTEDSIRATWADGLETFKKIREKYLLYR
ncbi:MAG: DUF1343 domain-containing protein [Chitinophagaceae bacterium]|nr:DUF1343 domain-containing protein [Chitinophagaceae bacterium]